jgi:arylsulfatase A
MRRTLCLLCLVLGSMLSPCWAGAADARPNIVLIMADDFGYECIAANGGTSYATPQIDALAASGMRFEHCYAQPLCTPTRAQIMTGKSNVRNYIRFGYLAPDQTTFANRLRDAGYKTGIVGKWQLGHGFEGPGRFGFDEYCLWQLTRRPPRYANPGLEIDGKQRDFNQGEYGPDLVNKYALDFVSRHRDQPFLLYYPMMLTHAPYQPTPDSPDWDPRAVGEKVNQDNRHFGEMVTHMDKLVGNLVRRLDELGLRERTLILFTGDNGTGKGVTSQMGEVKVEGAKGTMTDAGTRVPLVASWPGTIAAGRVSDDLVDMTDFLPTICEAAGVTLSSNATLDGRSFLPQLLGQKGQPRESIYCWYAPNQGRVDTPREFARDHRYRLFRDGAFFEVDSRTFREKKLDPDRLDPEASRAHRRLELVLEQYKDARPRELAPKK